MTTAPRILHRASEPAPTGGDVEASERAFHFLAGRPCLDLVATVGERWRRRIERLREPADLARWAVEAGLVDAAPPVSAVDLDEARRLRGAIARVAIAWGLGEDLDPDDVAVVNAAAARPDLAPQLDPDRRRGAPTTGTMGEVLSAVARDAIDLVTTADPTRLRECAADDCSLLFHDASRPGRRRWCSMAGCGNRHKTSQYRRRHATTR